MNFKKITALLILFTLIIIPFSAFADDDDDSCDAFIGSTDGDPYQLYAFFDLRDRESFVQTTYSNNPDFSGIGSDITVHIQIFDVNNNCNENNFFDTLTPNDTHIYNMRSIETNNGNPSGVVLPGDAYGIVVISLIDSEGTIFNTSDSPLVGNFRVLDKLGYEYRTNMAGIFSGNQQEVLPDGENGSYTFNFNQIGGVTLSDVVGISVGGISSGEDGINLANITDNFTVIDVDLYNNNEVPFSCRNIIFSCVDENSIRTEELLEAAANEGQSASVASFEYGINEVIPHSKSGELLCPNNVIGEGFALLTVLFHYDDLPGDPFFAGYVGLNNGNGRGSMDSFWTPNNQFDDGN